MSESDSSAATPTDRRAPVWVRVFHNNDRRDSCLVGYLTTHTVTEVFTYTTTRPTPDTHDHELADRAFELFNIGDDPTFGAPDERALDYRRCGNRSLSVGDLVAVDGCFYACDSIGWHELENPPHVRQATSPGTTRLY